MTVPAEYVGSVQVSTSELPITFVALRSSTAALPVETTVLELALPVPTNLSPFTDYVSD